MLTPAYRLTIGSERVDTTDEPKASTVVDLAVALDLDAPADSATLVLGRVGALAPVRDDEVTVELGYADDGGFEQVMKGTVAHVEPGLTTVGVVAYSGAASLLRTTTDKTYEGKTAGAIVRDLAGKAGVDVAAAEDGITFPAYVVDGRRSVFPHMQDLAALCGFDVYVNSDGKVVFERFVGGKKVHVYEFAKQIVELEVDSGPARAGKVDAFGESPGTGKGANAWAWLTKDFGPLAAHAGTGSPVAFLERAGLRTGEAARTAAEAALTAIRRRAVRGRLLGVGRPQVRLGDAVQVRGVPETPSGLPSPNGSFQVRSVSHRLTRTGRGFTTTVGFRSTT
jgi:phage protein D